MAIKRTVSIAEAKNRLPELVHEAERRPVGLARRGKPVAVLLSRSAYDSLVQRRANAWQALARFRARHGLEELDLAAAFERTRDRSRGRKIRW